MSCPLRLLGCGWARRPILWSAGRGGTTRSGARPLVHQRRREQRADDGSRRMIGTSKPPRHGPRQRWPRSQRLARSDNDARMRSTAGDLQRSDQWRIALAALKVHASARDGVGDTWASRTAGGGALNHRLLREATTGQAKAARGR